MNMTPKPNSVVEAHFPWQVPENPFNYRGLVSHPSGIGRIPSERYGTNVAIIGPGARVSCAFPAEEYFGLDRDYRIVTIINLRKF
jgi:hypothetical protein